MQICHYKIYCMFFNIFSYLQLSASSEISRSTPNDIVYYSMTTDCLVAMDRTNITFRARANNDISLALGSEDSSTSGTHYQIVIGGWSNTKSVIRFAIAGSACVYYNGSSLSQSFFWWILGILDRGFCPCWYRKFCGEWNYHDLSSLKTIHSQLYLDHDRIWFLGRMEIHKRYLNVIDTWVVTACKE